MQRILHEQGIKSVQGLADSSAAVSFGAMEETIGQALMEDDLVVGGVQAAEPEEDEDGDYEGSDDEGIDFRFVETEEDILTTFRSGSHHGAPARPPPAIAPEDRERLQGVLKELLDCRQLLDRVMKDG